MVTTNKGLNLPAAGSTGWNVPINANTDILDKAFGSFTTITTTTGVYDFTASDVQNMCIKSTTSAFVSNVTYSIPATIAGQWVIQNQSGTSAFTLTISNAAGGASVTIPRGTVRSIYSDGTNVVYADTPAGGDFTNVTVSGTLGVSGNTTLGGTITLKGALLDSVASQAQAESGTDNTYIMTPLRTRQSITLNAPITMAALTRGAIGSYAMLMTNNNTAVTGGGTTAGTNLFYVSLYRKYAGGANNYNWMDISIESIPTGTWRLMGASFSSASNDFTGLFLRIA